MAVVALGAYGRRELTPRAQIDVLFLHAGELSTRSVTETVCYPLWEQHLRIEPSVRTLAECVAETRRSWAAASAFLDARFISGQRSAFDALHRQITQPWRRDRERLRHRVRTDAQQRHASHPPAATSLTPDLMAGRGGLGDVVALHWLGTTGDPRLQAAHGFLLHALAGLDELTEHPPHRLSARVQQALAVRLGLAADPAAFLGVLQHHARWVGFQLDGALASRCDDRPLGASLAVRDGLLVGERLPPIERAPALGLRVANVVGLAPPAPALLAWATDGDAELEWDLATLDQWWLLLRAADWRAWDFLDVTGLLVRYVPELRSIWRRPGPTAGHSLALDAHSFLALRRLHEWTESGDQPLAARAWRPLRRRDWLYLAVLLHELTPQAVASVAGRLSLPDEARETLAFVVEQYRQFTDTATRRDLHDEDLLLDLAARIRTRQRLSLLLLVAVAHDLAAGPGTWTPWRADLVRQLFIRLEGALKQAGEVGARRTRSIEQHRARIARELERRGLDALLPQVGRLPRRYVLSRTPAFVARHLALLADGPLADGEVRVQAVRHHQPGFKTRTWDLLIVARDRPGLLATVAGVITLRGATTLAADAATSADGLVLDVFTVAGAHGQSLGRDQLQAIAADLQAALRGAVPLADLLGTRPMPEEEAEAIQVTIDNTASQFFSVVEVRAPDQVGLLYRIADGLHRLGLDIHHARIATHPAGALDVFYVRDLAGDKLDPPTADQVATSLTRRLRTPAA